MSKSDQSPRLSVDSIDAWKEWLKKYHLKKQVVWLVFKKKGAGPVPFDYQMALDEALCFGWVDSLLKAIDEKEYMRKFTPRKASSTWSETNKKRVEKLMLEGRMTAAGLRTVEVAKKNGQWDKGVQLPEVNDALPAALITAFQDHPGARDHYFKMKASSQKQFNIWINMAKRAETTRRRVDESIALLEQGRELGLK